ncbi:Hypothetical predicted protein [Mytilus galloprovincialis]|uniref:TIR domain-containing protein n=1 Tax=Mytilus galloprovincialis TaxID=29158 RepID=A0A8B6ES15_MYTGA|nr:Hypothetical predicted protein [Mytilus galloprovincialis]
MNSTNYLIVDEEIDCIIKKGLQDDNLEHKIKEVEKNRTMLPEWLRHDYFDAMIFYLESDRKVATVFCEQLKSLKLKHPLKPILHDDYHLDHVTRFKLDQLSQICDRSMFIFVLVTKNFVKNRASKNTDNQSTCNSKDSVTSDNFVIDDDFNSVFEAIVSYCDKGNKIIPVITEQGLSLPFGIGSRKAIDFSNQDDQYIEKLNHQFSQSDEERRKKEKQFIEKQYESIKNRFIPNIV